MTDFIFVFGNNKIIDNNLFFAGEDRFIHIKDMLTVLYVCFADFFRTLDLSLVILIRFNIGISFLCGNDSLITRCSCRY